MLCLFAPFLHAKHSASRIPFWTFTSISTTMSMGSSCTTMRIWQDVPPTVATARSTPTTSQFITCLNDELDPAYFFDCTRCDAIALPLLAFADHWDHAHAVAELHSSTIACEICGKGFGDGALLLAVHCGHFEVQHDCMSSKHFRILDQIDMLWEPPGIRTLQDIESSRQLSLPTLKLHRADIRFCLNAFTDMTDIETLSSSQSNAGHSMRQLTTNVMTANEPQTFTLGILSNRGPVWKLLHAPPSHDMAIPRSRLHCT